jgi:hypothetical protein
VSIKLLEILPSKFLASKIEIRLRKFKLKIEWRIGFKIDIAAVRLLIDIIISVISIWNRIIKRQNISKI